MGNFRIAMKIGFLVLEQIDTMMDAASAGGTSVTLGEFMEALTRVVRATGKQDLIIYTPEK